MMNPKTELLFAKCHWLIDELWSLADNGQVNLPEWYFDELSEVAAMLDAARRGKEKGPF